MPTIKALLGKVQDNKIKEINREFHGDRKGAKTRGLDYYVESADRRCDASRIACLYQKAAKQITGPSVSMFIQLHDMYMAHHSAEPPYDMDETIRLTCALDLKLAKLERCPCCGAMIFMRTDEVSVEKVCFVCKPQANRKCRGRESTVAPISIPSAARINQVVEEVTAPLLAAIQLVECGARPQEVELYVPGQEGYARKLWPKLLHTAAPQGPHPFAVLYYAEKVERRRHAAFVIKTFERLKQAGLQGAQLIVTLYKTYLHAFEGSTEIMHFARVRGIVHFYLLNELKLVVCSDCAASYVILHDELPGVQTCPTCRQIAGVQRSEKIVPAIGSRHGHDSASIIPPLPGSGKRRRATSDSPRKLAF